MRHRTARRRSTAFLDPTGEAAAALADATPVRPPWRSRAARARLTEAYPGGEAAAAFLEALEPVEGAARS